MRIAYDHQIFSMQSWGGISRYFVRLAEELDSADHDVSVMAHYHRNHHLESARASLIDGKSVTDWPHRFGRLAQRFNSVLTAGSLRRWSPDIIHQTYYQQKRRPTVDAPVVLTVYDMVHEIMPAVFRVNDRTPERKKRAVMYADHVICISENTRQDLLQFIDIDPAKTSVVHLGVDTPAPNNSNQQPSNCSSDQRPYILYVGQRGGYKNFHILLKAFAQSKRLINTLDIICFGGDPLSTDEMALANNLGLGVNQLTRQTGDDNELSRLYRQACVFVHSSSYEGFGLPPLEAMAHGCPVISSNASCMPEVLGSAAEYFDPQSTDELRGALESVVYSDDHQQKLRNAGLMHCETLTWANCAKNTLSVYETLLP